MTIDTYEKLIGLSFTRQMARSAVMSLVTSCYDLGYRFQTQGE